MSCCIHLMKENIYILSFMPLLHRIPRLKVSSPSQQIAFVIPLGQVASMFPHFFSSQPPLSSQRSAQPSSSSCSDSHCFLPLRLLSLSIIALPKTPTTTGTPRTQYPTFRNFVLSSSGILDPSISLLLFSSDMRRPKDIDPIRGLCFAEPIEVSGSYLEVCRRHRGAVVARARIW